MVLILGRPPDKGLVGANVKRMARRAVLRRAETPEARAGVDQDAGDTSGALRLGIRSPRAHDVTTFARDDPQVVVVVGADWIVMRPQRGWVGRAQRIQVRHGEAIAVPKLREATAPTDRWIVERGVRCARVQHDEQCGRLDRCHRFGLTLQQVAVRAARADDGVHARIPAVCNQPGDCLGR